MRTPVLRACIAVVLGSTGFAATADASSFQIDNGIAFTLQSNFGAFGPSSSLSLTGSDGTVLTGNGTALVPASVIDIFYSQNTGSFTSPNVPSAGTSGLVVVNPTSQQVSLTYTFLGFEASFTNTTEASFTNSIAPSNIMFTNQSTPAGTKVTSLVNLGPNGLVPLLFNSTAYSDPDGNNAGTAVNGGPIGDQVAMGFMLGSDPNVAYAFFKDIWQGGDLDFDDTVIEIQINPTPIPAALPLFLSGLGAIGWLGFRRQRRNAIA